jgi:uncharacterized protein (DUF488 family)
MSLDTPEVLTIGHSAHPLARFVALLKSAKVTAIADVRTSPYSRHTPHFNREALREALRVERLSYVFLGKELGGRPSDQKFYCEGVADYETMAQAGEFKKGLDRVVQGARKYRIALMCSERDPLDCHRCLLVARALVQRGVPVRHIMDNGKIVGHSEIEELLLRLSGRSGDDFFDVREERLATAYRERARNVAFSQSPRAKGSQLAE